MPMGVCSAPELTPVLIHVHIRIHTRIHIGIITFYLNFYFTLFDLISLSHFQFKLPAEFTTSPGTFGLLWFAGCVCSKVCSSRAERKVQSLFILIGLARSFGYSLLAFL